MLNELSVNNSVNLATPTSEVKNSVTTTSATITSIFNTTELPITSSASLSPPANLPSLAFSFEEDTMTMISTSEMTMLETPEKTTELADLSPTLMDSTLPLASVDEMADFNQLIESMFEKLCPAELTNNSLINKELSYVEDEEDETFTSFAALDARQSACFEDFNIDLYHSAATFHSAPSISIFAPYNAKTPYKVPTQVNAIHTRLGVAYMGDSYLFYTHQNDKSAKTMTVKANLQPVFVIDSPLPIFTPSTQTTELNNDSFELRFDTNLMRNFCINSNIVRVTVLTHEGSLLVDQSAFSLGAVDFVPVSENFLHGQIRLNMALPPPFHEHVKKLPFLHMIITVRYIDPMTQKIYYYDTHIRPSA